MGCFCFTVTTFPQVKAALIFFVLAHKGNYLPTNDCADGMGLASHLPSFSYHFLSLMKARLKICPKAEGYTTLSSPPLRQIAPHRHHDELEVNLVLAGKANYLLKGRRVPLSTGSMIWLFPKQEHVLIDCSDDFSMWVVAFKLALVNRYAGKGNRHILRSRDPGDIFCRQIEFPIRSTLSTVFTRARSVIIKIWDSSTRRWAMPWSPRGRPSNFQANRFCAPTFIPRWQRRRNLFPMSPFRFPWIN